MDRIHIQCATLKLRLLKRVENRKYIIGLMSFFPKNLYFLRKKFPPKKIRNKEYVIDSIFHVKTRISSEKVFIRFSQTYSDEYFKFC